MNRRQVILLILAVIAGHAALFWLLSGTRPLPKVAPIPRPNFFAREAHWTDEQTGEQYVYREFQVSTRLSMPDALMERRGSSGEPVSGEVSKGDVPANFVTPPIAIDQPARSDTP